MEHLNERRGLPEFETFETFSDSLIVKSSKMQISESRPKLKVRVYEARIKNKLCGELGP